MDIQKFLDKMKESQNIFLEYIENDDERESNFSNLIEYFEKSKIGDQMIVFKSFLYMIMIISNNHHHTPNFYENIINFLKYLLPLIQNSFSNIEIFNLFSSNKRILLFFIEEKIITIDESIIYYFRTSKFIEEKYIEYFLPEVKPFYESLKDAKIESNFEIKRKNAENDQIISQLIKNDSIEEFITYAAETNLSLHNTIIKNTIYETNSYLQDKHPNLIEYSIFCGSIRIFNYLRSNDVEINDKLWIWAVRGFNPEIIVYLEENLSLPSIECFHECFNVAIQCHHNNIAKYIFDNYLSDEKIDEYMETCLKYYNFEFIKNEFFDKKFFYSLCKCNMFYPVEFLLKNEVFDVNEFHILLKLFLNEIFNKMFNFDISIYI